MYQNLCSARGSINVSIFCFVINEQSFSLHEIFGINIKTKKELLQVIVLSFIFFVVWGNFLIFCSVKNLFKIP